MSVLIASTKAFQKIFVKAVCYTYNKTCDINYCSTLGRLSEYQIKQLVCTWADLNNESYNVRYKQEPHEAKYSECLNLRFSGETINTFQMLKSLQMIEYNIEVETIQTVRNLTDQEIKAVQILKKCIIEISSAIIHEIPEYQAAKYCLN